MSLLLTCVTLLLFGLHTNAVIADDTQYHTGDVNTLKILSTIKQEYIDYYNCLSYDERQTELITISQTYQQAGELLSEKDSAIILLSFIDDKASDSLKSGFADEWYDVYKTQFGVKVNLFGRMRQDVAFIAGSSRFGGTATAKIMEGSISHVGISIHHTAYGVVGNTAPYVGILYNGDVSMSKSGNNRFTRMDKESEYGSILPLYTTMYASATVTTDSGDEFTITSDTWKK